MFAAIMPFTRPELDKTSKFLSYVLRHKPDAIGIHLDTEGWAAIDELISGAAQAGKAFTPSLIAAVVADNDKQRFELSPDGQRIRALQGHSTSLVQREMVEKQPPPYLYHGTATRFLASIRKQGLLPGQRHYVHLSADEKTARAVGKRYGAPVVLTIAAQPMQQHGLRFYQAENGVWLTLNVPVAFISFSQ